MTRDYDFAVSLRIRHPAVDPDVLTAALGLTPQYAWRAGAERRATGEGGSATGTYRETLWIAPLNPEPVFDQVPVPLEGVLLLGANRLHRNKQLWSRLMAEGGSAELLVEIFGRDTFTLELSSMTLSQLARSRIAVSVRVHPMPRAVAVA
ncbi:MAG TPA: hypothetical protein VIN61_08160 [Gammaproteobacteria bacterium]